MSILLGSRVVRIPKAYFISQLATGTRASRQEMPTVCRADSPVALHIRTLFSSRQRGSLVRIDTDINDVKFPADAPFHISCALHKSVQHERAEHRAFVIAHHEHHRLLTEILG